MSKESKKKQYNDEPVFCCKRCLSLNIKTVDGMDYCDDCGSTDLDYIHIDVWESIYEDMHGEKYIKD